MSFSSFSSSDVKKNGCTVVVGTTETKVNYCDNPEFSGQATKTTQTKFKKKI